MKIDKPAESFFAPLLQSVGVAEAEQRQSITPPGVPTGAPTSPELPLPEQRAQKSPSGVPSPAEQKELVAKLEGLVEEVAKQTSAMPRALVMQLEIGSPGERSAARAKLEALGFPLPALLTHTLEHEWAVRRALVSSLCDNAPTETLPPVIDALGARAKSWANSADPDARLACEADRRTIISLVLTPPIQAQRFDTLLGAALAAGVPWKDFADYTDDMPRVSELLNAYAKSHQLPQLSSGSQA